ncbi:MAG: DUF2075 domain-containing protein [Burkholderiales bacterium]|nr:DUF2075 domain-containing protein [Burkholderiales bacterium]
MIIYQALKKQFLDDVFRNDIEQIILDQYWRRTGRKVSPAEVKAWASSLGYMGKVLHDASIPDDCGVAIEYSIPQTAKRIDFLVTGKAANDQPCVVIVELKQWQHARRTDKDAVVATRFASGEAEVNHPSYQAWSYAALLKGFNEAVYTGGIQLEACAYLHNYPEDGDPLNDSFYAEHVSRAPMYFSGSAQRELLRQFIARHVRRGDMGEALYRIENGRIRPSKSLADALLGLLRGNPEFVLVDDQKLVYEEAVKQAHRAQTGEKRVLIVEGGPGTGKSVVAVNLLVGLAGAGLIAKYVTKNSAPREVYQAKLNGHFKRTEISHLFTGSGSFTNCAQDEFGALIVDEAHRLNEKSGLYANLGENQVMELVRAARFCIFFIDESQRVTLRDIGTRESIERWACEFGASVTRMELSSQFRCNGSDGYLAWLDHTLQVRETANPELDPRDFDFRVADSPNELRRLVEEKNRERNRARMVAGYCWSWPSKKDAKAFDIVMPDHGFRARWNLVKDGSLWIVSEESVSEVGCIHTCQGLEVDYIGVIVADDMVVRDGHVVTRPEARAHSDKSIHGLKALARKDPQRARSEADAIIKNTYRTLMTRGMKGCYIYCTDAETAAYFRSRIHTPEAPAIAPIAVLPPHAATTVAANSAPFRILRRSEVRPFEDAVPVIPLKLAAGQLSAQWLDDEVDEWAAPDGVSIGPGMFIAQVVGESMNRKIPNGAWCLFRRDPAGTRQKKIVLARHRDISDPDTGASYTVKQYSSEKQPAEEGDWAHARIVLSPMSTDPVFSPIVIEAGKAGDVAVIAELVAVLV